MVTSPWSHKAVSHFLANINKSGPLMPGMKTRCHDWVGTTVTCNGEGNVAGVDGKAFVKANRFIWQHLNGLLPTDDSVDISPKCHNPRCCNPEHMRAVDSHDHGHVFKEQSACGLQAVAPIVRHRLAA